MRFVLFPKAYAKLIFHCCKYPHKELNGVLIGSISKKDNSVHVNDVIPLFHFNLALSPMLEVALAQVSTCTQDVIREKIENTVIVSFLLCTSVGRHI